jgi:hypothetical protein
MHALVDGWLAIEDGDDIKLVAPDGSILDDPRLSPRHAASLEGDREIEIVGRWPDALFAVVLPPDIEDVRRWDPTPILYRWSDGWIEVDTGARPHQRHQPGVGSPAWFYQSITPGRDGTLLGYRVHYQIVEGSGWRAYRAEEHDKLWILDAEERPFALETTEVEEVQSTASGVVYVVGAGRKTLHRCDERKCTLLAAGHQHTAMRLVTVGNDALVWGLEGECKTPGDPYGTCLVEFDKSGRTNHRLSNVSDVYSISPSPDRTLWIVAGGYPGARARLFRRTPQGELRPVNVLVGGELTEDVSAYARDRETPLFVVSSDDELLVTQPVGDASP